MQTKRAPPYPFVILGRIDIHIVGLLAVPLYAFGVPVLRSLVWALSLVGLVMVVAVLVQ